MPPTPPVAPPSYFINTPGGMRQRRVQPGIYGESGLPYEAPNPKAPSFQRGAQVGVPDSGGSGNGGSDGGGDYSDSTYFMNPAGPQVRHAVGFSDGARTLSGGTGHAPLPHTPPPTKNYVTGGTKSPKPYNTVASPTVPAPPAPFDPPDPRYLGPPVPVPGPNRVPPTRQSTFDFANPGGGFTYENVLDAIAARMGVA